MRAEYPYIDEDYKNYLLKTYEDTYYPEKLLGAGKAVYVKRNYEMIDKSDFCIFYYNAENSPTTRQSGTKIALQYAIERQKHVIKLPDFSCNSHI